MYRKPGGVVLYSLIFHYRGSLRNYLSVVTISTNKWSFLVRTFDTEARFGFPTRKPRTLGRTRGPMKFVDESCGTLIRRRFAWRTKTQISRILPLDTRHGGHRIHRKTVRGMAGTTDKVAARVNSENARPSDRRPGFVATGDDYYCTGRWWIVWAARAVSRPQTHGQVTYTAAFEFGA